MSAENDIVERLEALAQSAKARAESNRVVADYLAPEVAKLLANESVNVQTAKLATEYKSCADSDDKELTTLTEAAAEIVRLRGEVERQESSHGNTIDQRDRAYEMIDSVYAAVMDANPEWSSVYGFADALNDIEGRIHAIRSATIAPAEAKVEVPGEGWPLRYTPQPADGGAVASHYGEGAAFGDTARMIRRGFDAPCKICGKLCDEGNGPCATPPAAQAQDTSSWPMLDRVEFALRDAGFDYDEAFRIAHLAAHPSACELAAVRALIERWHGWIGQYDTGDAAIRDCIDELEAALQHRGDSQEVGRG